jgi:DNA circularisation protein N-terminus
MRITDLAGTSSTIRNQWRHDLKPASFRGVHFHVESGSKESGRRIVVHEFPKKDFPYSEDMGRRAYEFSVRGYCICYPFDIQSSDPGYELQLRDYRVARDALDQELTRGEPGILQLPTMAPMLVVCPRYRLSEEERFGGYCVFDMQFTEYGQKLGEGEVDPRGDVGEKLSLLRQRVVTRVDTTEIEGV